MGVEGSPMQGGRPSTLYACPRAPSEAPRAVLRAGGLWDAVVAISPNCINDNDQNHKKSGLLTTDPRHPWPNTGEKRVRCGASHSEPVETNVSNLPTNTHEHRR